MQISMELKQLDKSRSKPSSSSRHLNRWKSSTEVAQNIYDNPDDVEDDAHSFASEDFELPAEEIDDGYVLEQTCDELEHRNIRLEQRATEAKESLLTIDSFCSSPISESSSSTIKTKSAYRKLLVGKEAKIELDAVKISVGKLPPNRTELLAALSKPLESSNPLKDEKLAQIDDLRQEQMERWCQLRGLPMNVKFLNKDKRLLRNWFHELDNDGSGEVSVLELQDPMISSGILKTREQVIRVLANVDKNHTFGIDFEEFLQALNGNTGFVCKLETIAYFHTSYSNDFSLFVMYCLWLGFR